jgi:hypothetical protein
VTWLFPFCSLQVRKAAGQISAQELSSLLFVALRTSALLLHDYFHTLEELLRVPTMEQLEQEVIWEVLIDAVRNTRSQQCPSNDMFVGLLLKKCNPAVQALPARVLESELKVEGNGHTVRFLSKLPAGQQAEVAVVEKWLREAVESGNVDGVRALCTLPAARQVEVAVLEEWLRGAVENGNVHIVGALCQLPAARQIEAAVLGEWLRVAVQMDNVHIGKVLCQLPATWHVELPAVL